MSKKGGDDAAAANAAQARSDEQARQDKIRAGTSRINALFDGTPIPPDPNAVRSTSPGAAPNFGSTDLSGALTNGSKAANGASTTTTTPDPLAGNTFGGFTNDFYNNIVKSYSDYATPQLEDQLAGARKQLTYSLDRSHLLDSSARADQEGTLAKAAGTARQQVADTALATGNQARTAVEGARSDLINTLDSTGDVQGSVNSALSRATALSQPTQFSPLGSMFANFTSGLGTQAAAEKANYYTNGAISPAFNTGLFAPSGSVRVS